MLIILFNPKIKTKQIKNTEKEFSACNESDYNESYP